MQTISDKGLNFIKGFEGNALRAYRDSVGVWTIGYGLTNMDKGLPWKIQAGLTISQSDADGYLIRSLRDNYETAVSQVLPGVPQNVFDMGDSFHFNTGAVKKATWPASYLRKDMASARVSLLSWNHGGGQVIAGLTRRRNAEWACISTGNYGAEGEDHKVAAFTPILSSVPTPTTRPGPGMIGLHDTGPEVVEAQTWLNQLKLEKRVPTGTFDLVDDAAVRKYQGSHKQLSVDGIIGPATRNAIQRELKATTHTGNLGKAVGTAALSSGIAWKAVGAKLALGVVSVTGVLVLGLGVYVVYHYRDEIMARVNRLIGRTTS